MTPRSAKEEFLFLFLQYRLYAVMRLFFCGLPFLHEPGMSEVAFLDRYRLHSRFSGFFVVSSLSFSSIRPFVIRYPTSELTVQISCPPRLATRPDNTIRKSTFFPSISLPSMPASRESNGHFHYPVDDDVLPTSSVGSVGPFRARLRFQGPRDSF